MGKKFTNFSINLEGLAEKEQWYALITTHNYEQFVIDRIKGLNSNIGNLISEAFTPIQQVPTEGTRKGVKVIKMKEEKLMPHYVFIKTKLDVDMWKLVMNITGVTSIMCTAGTPSAITEAEINKMKLLMGDQQQIA